MDPFELKPNTLYKRILELAEKRYSYKLLPESIS
jgi:hypothetical protein